MKIELIAFNSKYIHSNYAVLLLQSYADSKGFKCGCHEFTVNQPADVIMREIYQLRPDVLAFSTYIWNVSLIEKLIPDIARILPQTQLWLGGPEASYRDEELLQSHPELSGIIRGEGETVFAELCSYWSEKDGSGLSDINGITFRENEKIIKNPDQELIDPDDIPFPYIKSGIPKDRIFYYESSRGCPYGCSYCLSAVDKKVRLRNPDKVKNEIRFFLDSDARQVKFVDRTFNCNKERTLELLEFIKENDNGTTNFHFEVGIELFDNEELSLLGTLRPGQVQLECGIQTLNDRTLDAINRKNDFKKIKNNVNIIKSFNNIHLHLDLIAGLPYEDLESFKRSFDKVYALKSGKLQLGFLKMLSGAPIFAAADDFGCVYKKSAPYEVLFTSDLSYDDVIVLKSVEEQLEVYYNSGQFLHTMELLETKFDSAFDMYLAIAGHYRDKELLNRSHSRISRYDILLDFIKEIASEDEMDDFRDCLIRDLYLRENLKSRPSWAGDMKAFDNKIRDFYKKEAEEPFYLKNYSSCDHRQMRSMTHIEVFKDKVILFDYLERDPLDHSAREYFIDW